MGTVDGLVAAMESLLGMGEVPPGSNHVPGVTDWYADNYGNQYRATAWCDIAVSYAAHLSGNLDAIMGPFAWTPSHAAAFQRAGRWQFGTSGIQRGDVLFFNWSGPNTIANIDHVGVVAGRRSDGAIETVEANTTGPDGHDTVMRRLRNPSVVVGYGRPAFDGVPVLVPVGNVTSYGRMLSLPMARQGSTGDLVRRVQDALNDIIGAGLVVDGVFGPRTRAAVEAFQNRFRLGVDGVVGPKTWTALVQGLLLKHGFDPHGIDGVFGPDTTTATRDFQQREGLEVDGIVGPATWGALLW